MKLIFNAILLLFSLYSCSIIIGKHQSSDDNILSCSDCKQIGENQFQNIVELDIFPTSSKKNELFKSFFLDTSKIALMKIYNFQMENFIECYYLEEDSISKVSENFTVKKILCNNVLSLSAKFPKKTLYTVSCNPYSTDLGMEFILVKYKKELSILAFENSRYQKDCVKYIDNQSNSLTLFLNLVNEIFSCW